MISFIIPTHNASNQALITVSALSDLIEGWGEQAEVIVVDDGSTESEWDVLRANGRSGLTLVRHAENQGRSAALNSGAEAAKGDCLIFLDCDCRPEAASFLEEHLAVLDKGNDVSVGPITTRGAGFWGRYQREAAKRRARQFASGRVFAMTSANMMIKREWFHRVGGFDTRYRGYGFEDRDLLLRLSGAGARIALARATVFHDADLHLPSVVRKMMEAGRLTAPLFRQMHPEAYRQLGYAAVDVNLNKWLVPFGNPSGRVAKWAAPHVERTIGYLPYPVAEKLVRITSALAFMSGTAGAG